MSAMASQTTSLTMVYSAVYSRCRWKKRSKLRVTGLCEGNSPVTGEFPVQRASNAEDVSIWWRHHAQNVYVTTQIQHLPNRHLIIDDLVSRQQAIYLSQCWTRSMSPLGVIRPRFIKLSFVQNKNFSWPINRFGSSYIAQKNYCRAPC